MSGSSKQSFYEIQLSNGSLIAAFVVAVAIGVAVFALGVRIGKAQAPTSPASSDFVDNFAAEPPEDAAASSDFDFSERVMDPIEGDSTAADPESNGESTAPPPGDDSSQSGEPAAEAPAPSESLPAADMNIANGFVIQVKSTPDRAEANNLQAALAGAGFPAFVVSGDVRGETFYRVRVGRYRERNDAEQVASVLSRRSEIEDTWITEG